jgi:hypothetical protein
VESQTEARMSKINSNIEKRKNSTTDENKLNDNSKTVLKA